MYMAELENPTVKPDSTEQFTITKNPRVLVSEVDGEVIMLSVERGKYYGLNATGSALWKLLEFSPNIEQLKTALQRDYDVDPSACELEVKAVLGQLKAEGLIEFA